MQLDLDSTAQRQLSQRPIVVGVEPDSKATAQPQPTSRGTSSHQRAATAAELQPRARRTADATCTGLRTSRRRQFDSEWNAFSQHRAGHASRRQAPCQLVEHRIPNKGGAEEVARRHHGEKRGNAAAGYRSVDAATLLSPPKSQTRSHSMPRFRALWRGPSQWERDRDGTGAARNNGWDPQASSQTPAAAEEPGHL